MGIYVNEWLEFIVILDINSSNTEIILKILRKLFDFPSVKSQGKYKYISIEECNGNRLLKSKYYNENKDTWGTDYQQTLTKIDKKYCDELILDEKNKCVYDNLISSALKDYILDYGWYKNSSVDTTYYGDEPLGRHYLQYIIEINIENSSESIKLFKNKLAQICEENKIYVIPQLYRQTTNSMIFIKISELINKRLYETDYYKHHYPFWNLEKYSVGRSLITDTTKLEFDSYESNLLNILLKSEISSNIVCHGWYNVYD